MNKKSAIQFLRYISKYIHRVKMYERPQKMVMINRSYAELIGDMYSHGELHWINHQRLTYPKDYTQMIRTSRSFVNLAASQLYSQYHFIFNFPQYNSRRL